MGKFVSLIIAQLILGLVNCNYGPAISRDWKQPQQQTGYGQPQQQLFRDMVFQPQVPVPTTTTTTVAPVVQDSYDYSSYGQQSYEQPTEMLVDPCLPNPCDHQGTCVSTEQMDGFWCYCDERFSGDFCETEVPTTTTTTTTTTTRRPQPPRVVPVVKQQGYNQPQQLPILRVPQPPVRQQTSYGQPQQQIVFDLPTTTTTPVPFVPVVSVVKQQGYNQPQPQLPIIRTPPPVVQPPPQQSYGQQTFLPSISRDPVVVPAPVAPVVCQLDSCLNGGSCFQTGFGTIQCSCPWGYVGARCEECITDCKSNPCTGNSLCRARYGGGFDCVCPTGLTGQNCDIQNDLCTPATCLNGGLCTSLAATNDFTCQCRDGFTGKRCEQTWQNPCSEEVLRQPFMMQFEAPWNKTSYLICSEPNTWIEMPCASGTIFNKRLGKCVGRDFIEPACPEGFCKNDGECGIVEATGQLGCKCKDGFAGANCEINVDECAVHGGKCRGGLCVDQVNVYYCICPQGVGLSCENTIPEPCDHDDLTPEESYHEIPSQNGDTFLQCKNQGTWEVRRCAPGLFWHQELKTCTMDKPPVRTGACLTSPCSNGAKCEDVGYNQYRCLCREGYTGPHCEQVIDYCLASPCKNGGRCLSYTGGYTCVCPDKIIDECCCNGVINPCSDKSSVYFPHVLPNRYIHCDVEGRAFVRTCPQNTRWIQPLLSCISEEIISANAAELTTATTTPVPVLRDLLPQPSVVQGQYGQQQQLLDLPVEQETQQQMSGYGQDMSDDRLGRMEQRPVNTLQGQQVPFGQTRGAAQQQVNRLQQVQPQQAAGARNFQQQEPLGRVQVQPEQQQFGRSSQMIQVPQLQTPIDLQVPVVQQQQQRLVQSQAPKFRPQF